MNYQTIKISETIMIATNCKENKADNVWADVPILQFLVESLVTLIYPFSPQLVPH